MAVLAAYNFDEASGSTVLDATGNGRSFTFAGTTSRTAGGGGHTDKGMTQSSAEDSTTMTAFGQTADRTLMCWIKCAADIADGRVFEFVGGGESVWELLLRPGVYHVQAWNAATFGRATFTRPTDGLWHHWCGVYDSTANEIRAYLDGVLQTTTSFTGPLRTTAASIHVMNNCGPNVVVDDVRVLDQALTAGAIAAYAATPVSSVTSVIGTGVANLGATTATAVGKRSVSGTGGVVLPTTNVHTAVGKVSHPGIAGGGLPPLVAQAFGVRERPGTGSAPLGGPSGTAVGRRTVSGTGTAGLAALAGAGTGGNPTSVTGTGSATLPAPSARAIVYSVGEGDWLTSLDMDSMRADQESIMYDRIRIRHNDPADGEFDDDAGYAPVTMPEPYYDGKARVQARPVMSSEKLFAGEDVSMLGYVVAIPWHVTGVRPSDLIEVYSSRDPGAILKTITIQDVQTSTFETARRMSCIDYQEREAS